VSSHIWHVYSFPTKLSPMVVPMVVSSASRNVMGRQTSYASLSDCLHNTQIMRFLDISLPSCLHSFEAGMPRQG
jgi:hypothetical protein